MNKKTNNTFGFETRRYIHLNIEMHEFALDTIPYSLVYYKEGGGFGDHKLIYEGKNIIPISNFQKVEDVYSVKFEVYDPYFFEYEDSGPVRDKEVPIKIIGFVGPKNLEKIKKRPDAGDYIVFDKKAVSVPDCKAGLIKTGKYVIVKEPIILVSDCLKKFY